MEDFFGGGGLSPAERRALPRIISPPKLVAAVDNLTRHEMLGTAEVADFSCLGMAVRGLPGDPVAAMGDRLWVSLIAEEGIIPLTAKLVYVRRDGLMGLKIDTPSAAGQHFLLRLYERAARPAAAPAARPLDAV
ncbi:MAG: hypothetical protein QOJ70_2534 [Acidobacteriota bacterium]|nr:hypothetical protein [Acidobacteriota bacterium]MDT7808721.1 hypothetical protein [Acidobacteriota bacterium]